MQISIPVSALAMLAYWGVNLMASFLFLLSPTLRSILFCAFTLIFPFWTLLWVWSCRVPVPAIPALPLATGEGYYFVVWLGTLWSITAKLLGETPRGVLLVVVGLSGIVSFVYVSMVYRQVLAQYGPKHLRFNTPPIVYAVAILENLIIKFNDGIMVEMAPADVESTEPSPPPPYFTTHQYHLLPLSAMESASQSSSSPV